jgi:hypothetical protein
MANRHSEIVQLKRIFLGITVLAALSICIACDKIEDDPDTENEQEAEIVPDEAPKLYDFALYFLADTNLKIKDIFEEDQTKLDSLELAELELQTQPWISDEDLLIYDFSSHLMYLEGKRDDHIPEGNPIATELPSAWCYRPFVAVAEGEKQYVGYLAGDYANTLWPLPRISKSYSHLYPEDILVIQQGYFIEPSEDQRSDSQIKESLDKAELLHEGLQLTLNEIESIENGDTATVTYTFTLLNKDEDNLYVMDPNKVGDDVFQHFNLGLQFRRLVEGGVLTPSLTKDITIPAWSPDWYFKLNCGDSLTRTVSLKAYPTFSPGAYECILSFTSYKSISKDQRTLSDGRYWIGPIDANYLTIEYKE